MGRSVVTQNYVATWYIVITVSVFCFCKWQFIWHNHFCYFKMFQLWRADSVFPSVTKRHLSHQTAQIIIQVQPNHICAWRSSCKNIVHRLKVTSTIWSIFTYFKIQSVSRTFGSVWHSSLLLFSHKLPFQTRCIFGSNFVSKVCYLCKGGKQNW